MHVSGPVMASVSEFARLAASVLGAGAGRVEERPMDAFGFPEQRPRFNHLACDRLFDIMGGSFPDAARNGAGRPPQPVRRQRPTSEPRMKAAVLCELNRPLAVEPDIGIPPLKPGQVLVRVAYSGVCHSQLMEVRGKRGADPYLPHLLGHEGSGYVEDTGPGVSKVQRGDRVILGWIKGRGMEAGGTVYSRGERRINAGGVTTFNEHAVVSENRCVLVPAGVPMDIAVLFGCAIPTGAGIVTNTLCPAPGSSVAVFGLGGVGLSALMATGLYDCAAVIAVDVEDDKLALARDFGASATINARRQDPVAAIYELTGGRGVDCSIEAAGTTASIEQAFRAVRRAAGAAYLPRTRRRGRASGSTPTT